jgi:hypothetical protein
VAGVQRLRRLERSSVLLDRVSFRGHPMVSALHPRTIEVTTEDHLSERGDCIIGVGADKGCAGLATHTKGVLQTEGARLVFRIMVVGQVFEVNAFGDPRLSLAHPTDIVLRRSSFVTDRTIALKADYAAVDLPRRMVEKLRSEETRGVLEIEVVGR